MKTRQLFPTGMALLMVVGLVAAGCSDKKATSGSAAPTTTTTTVATPGSPLTGMKGTSPLANVSQSFRNRLLTIDPKLTVFDYGAESYDVTIIIALAATQAKTDGSAYAEKINGITRGGTKCKTFRDCKKIIDDGGDPDYDGASGPLDFSGNGEPTKASYAVLQFGTMRDSKSGLKCGGSKECIDADRTTFMKVSAPSSADVPQVSVTGSHPADGTLTIGTLLPQTGSLTFMGPAEFAGVKLALDEINANGGFSGKDVAYVEGDSGDSTNGAARQNVQALLGKNVDAIIGAASSPVTLSIINDVTSAGVVLFSPSSTSKELSTYDDKGLFFRDSPSDVLQATALARLLRSDHRSKIFILARNDDYGTGLAADLKIALATGGGTVLDTKMYDPAASDLSSESRAAKDSGADAIALIGADESSRIIELLHAQRVDLRTVYGVDRNMVNALAGNFEHGK